MEGSNTSRLEKKNAVTCRERRPVEPRASARRAFGQGLKKHGGNRNNKSSRLLQRSKTQEGNFSEEKLEVCWLAVEDAAHPQP